MTEEAKPRLGAGDVPVEIDGEKFTLVPTLNAARVLSARDGLRGAMRRVLDLDTNTILEVVGAGLTHDGYRPPADMAERIWRTGFMLSAGGVADAAFTYLNVLANGGRPLPSTDGEARQDSGDPPAS